MHILFITNVFPTPCVPSKGVFNLGTARALASFHDVRVVAPVLWTEELFAPAHGHERIGESRSGRAGRIEVHYPRYYYTPKILRSLYGTFLWQSVRGTLHRMVEAEPIDVVLSYWAHPDGEVAVRLAKELGVPSVVMVGGSDVLVLTKSHSRSRHVYNTLAAADAVVAVSRDLQHELVKHGIDPTKTHVVNRGVDLNVFEPGDRREARRRLGLPLAGSALLWVGRMVPVKGLDVLLAASRRLKDRGVEHRLYLVGEGPLRKSLEAEGRRLGLEESLVFAGTVPHDRLGDWYRAADLTVLPSLSEGIPNVLRESIACGTPFVASHVGGIEELVAGDTMRLVEPGNPEALAKAIEGCLENPEEPVVSSVPQPSVQESIEPLLSLLEELTERRAGESPGRREAVNAGSR